MNKYMLQMDQGVVGIRWEHTFEIASDKMAREYVLRLIETDRASARAHGFHLFNMTTGIAVAWWEVTQPSIVLRERTR